MHSEPLFRPWGIVDPAFWTGSDEVAGSPLPDLTEQLADIRSTASDDLARANTLAEDLDARITAAHGEAHADTVRVREVRAYLAHLTGHHGTAVAWYLHVVRLHAVLHGPEHPETALAVRRAYSMWKALPAPDATRLADDLLEAFTELRGAGQQASLRMRKHLEQLRQPGADAALAAPTIRLRARPRERGE
ncbi:hypothetical protein [Streptomyces sp. ISL-94]|uniref:hypothetical protein n=1 Tax=Streptomyces sp. ISL-94 TaxID=2819190 RepID=UPI001BEB82D5|nr:hypothetical protein [Streptomyces sp. ISL-94]MBT2478148.1 hypothetical protein [Streptomyces sp. ISL-94]